jgi:hypothetical protein
VCCFRSLVRSSISHFTLFKTPCYKVFIVIIFGFWCKSNTSFDKLQIGNFDEFISKNYTSKSTPSKQLQITLLFIH